MFMAKHTAGQAYASTESFLRLQWYVAQGLPDQRHSFRALCPLRFFLQVCPDAFWTHIGI